MAMQFYTGGYTMPAVDRYRDAKGIKLVFRDEQKGEWQSQQMSSPDNPSYLCLHPNGQMLYGVGEDLNGWVFSCRIAQDGSLFDLRRLPSLGDHPCHIALSEDGSILAVCNYSSGSVIFYPVEANGNIGQHRYYFHPFAGHGNLVERQSKPHTHTAAFLGGYCYICELGCDKIYRIAEEKIRSFCASAEDMEEVFDFTGDGNITGVRMGVFTGDGNYYFAGGELDNKIHCFAVNPWRYLGAVEAARTKGENYFAHIALSKDEKYLYASMRGENSIVRFVRENGALCDPIWFDCGGSWPRMFAITEAHLICANQYDGGAAIFAIQENGMLQLLECIGQAAVSMILPIE